MSHEEFEVWKKEVLPHDAAMLETHHRFATGKTAPEEDVVVSESSSDDSSSSGGGVHWCDIDMPYSVLPRKWKEANRTPAKTLVDAQDARSVAPQATVNASGQVKRLELIGSGTTSRVYKGVDSRSGRFIAAKVMHFASSDVKRKGHLQRMKDEIDVLSQISSCPNVVRYLGAAVNLGMCELEVFSEYCGGGSVQAILDGVSKGGVASRGDGGGGGSGLSEDTAKRYASDALSGLVYLHQLEPPVIHGDIKVGNDRFSLSLSLKTLFSSIYNQKYTSLGCPTLHHCFYCVVRRPMSSCPRMGCANSPILALPIGGLEARRKAKAGGALETTAKTTKSPRATAARWWGRRIS
jgi:hypothetical protein